MHTEAGVKSAKHFMHNSFVHSFLTETLFLALADKIPYERLDTETKIEEIMLQSLEGNFGNTLEECFSSGHLHRILLKFTILSLHFPSMLLSTSVFSYIKH